MTTDWTEFNHFNDGDTVKHTYMYITTQGYQNNSNTISITESG